MLAAIFTVLLFFSPSDFGLSEGRIVTLKAPRNLYRAESVALRTSAQIYVAQILPDASGDEGCSIEGVLQWKERGWPLMTELQFLKAKEQKGKYIELEFRDSLNNSYNKVIVKLRFSMAFNDINRAVTALVQIGRLEEFERSAYFSNLLKDRLAKSFTGPLSQIPVDVQHGLLKMTDYQAEDIHPEIFKGQTYLALDVPNPGIIYNTLQVNLAGRTASTIKANVLPRLKRMANSIQSTPSIYGVKLRVTMLHRNFVREYSNKPETLEIYAPYEAIKQFVNLDITDQSLINKCIVVVDGNRVDVDLSLATTP